MAMTGRVIFWGYRRNQYDLKNLAGGPATQGIPFNLPAHLCSIRPVEAATTANGVTMNSIIELLPSGLWKNGQSTLYFSADTVATLQTNGT